MKFELVTDKGDVSIELLPSDQDCWSLSVTGVVESWLLPAYEEDTETNVYGPASVWEAVAWVASIVESRGATVLHIMRSR